MMAQVQFLDPGGDAHGDRCFECAMAPTAPRVRQFAGDSRLPKILGLRVLRVKIKQVGTTRKID